MLCWEKSKSKGRVQATLAHLSLDAICWSHILRPRPRCNVALQPHYAVQPRAVDSSKYKAEIKKFGSLLVEVGESVKAAYFC